MLRIGLTGSIATGKTTVLEAFGTLGIPIYSADTAVHELYRGEAAPLIENMFPGTVRAGIVDRKALSNQLSGDPQRLKELEALIHPLAREKAMQFFDRAESDGADMAVIEIPLLLETGSQYPLDQIVVTHCPSQVQEARALARPGMTREKLDFILSRQVDQEQKKQAGDWLIDTGNTIAETEQQVRTLVERLRNGKG